MTAVGALIGLALSIILIFRKIPTVYALILGALVGGLCGGIGLEKTISEMIAGINSVSAAVIRILAAGVLSGVLVKTGAAESIANTIIEKLGHKRIYLALSFSVMFLTAIGVFIDVAVITVAPVALSVRNRVGNLSISSLLVMMVGGGKCGNIISPNPNTIACATNFNADLYSVMYSNLIPALLGLILTVFVIGRILPKPKIENAVKIAQERQKDQDLPKFWCSILGPIVSILLLSLRPICSITIDPLVALPVGGLVGIVATGQYRIANESVKFGLSQMVPVAVLLIATGAIAGIISASTIKDFIVLGLNQCGISQALLAPISGILMAGATASTTAGATVASASFASIIIASGVSAVWGAAMVNAGATVIDQLPHGSFFHATGGVVGMAFKERIRLLPYEAAIGFFLATMSTICYFIVA